MVDLRDMERGYGYVRAPGGGPKNTGLNEQVQAQIAASPVYQRILNQVCDCIHTLALDRDEIRVAIGCKWGKHRSVAMVEDLSTVLCGLADRFGFNVGIWHLERFRWDRSAQPVEVEWKEKLSFSFRA